VELAQPERLRVVMRTDARPAVGLGHVMRLRAVAQAFGRFDAEVSVIGEGLGRSVTQDRVWDIRAIDVASTEMLSEAQDADRTVRLIGPLDPAVVMVDDYRLGAVWERRIKDAIPDTTIVALDDLPDRDHAADVLVDPNLDIGQSTATTPAHERVLRGTAFVPLSNEYLEGAAPREVGSRPEVLVSLGGGSSALTVQLARALAGHPRAREVSATFVVPDALDRSSVGQASAGVPSIRVVASVPSLRPLLDRSDLAIGAGGTSAWQRLRVGLPSVVVAVAPNQVRTCRALEAAGLARWIDDLSPDRIIAGMFETLDDAGLRQRARDEGPVLVDGRGAQRIALALVPDPCQPTFRPVTRNDAAALLAIANDPETRASSRHVQRIGPAVHLAWLDRTLRTGEETFWVAESDGLVVGQVRFSDVGGAWELNYALDPVVRGRGWSKLLVAEGIRMIRKRSGAPILAVVNGENMASRRTLLGLGFVPDPEALRARAFGARVEAGFSTYLLDPKQPTP
jgi:UDP-2,4-diacetamido-2,4,6-trideoxy-beta-L-altropyranose hydrolase